jgi:hypothetical protein
MNRKLYLHEYLLNDGLCKGLAAAFKQYPDCITQLCLSSNGLLDKELAALTEGIQGLRDIKCVVIKHNEIGSKTID